MTDPGKRYGGFPVDVNQQIEGGAAPATLTASNGDLVWAPDGANQFVWQRVGNQVFFFAYISGTPTFTTGAGSLGLLLPITPMVIGYTYYPLQGILVDDDGGVDASIGDIYLEINAADRAYFNSVADGDRGTARTVAQLLASGTAIGIAVQGWYFIEPGYTFRENGNASFGQA